MSRLEHIKFALSNGIFAVHESVMQSALDFLQSENISAISSEERANNSVTYMEMGTLAVIDIEGAMYKKNIGGFCMSVLSYPDIIAKIDQAEANPKITDIMFNLIGLITKIIIVMFYSLETVGLGSRLIRLLFKTVQISAVKLLQGMVKDHNYFLQKLRTT
jgi:hypothetical protein